jgi:hypothetical protein
MTGGWEAREVRPCHPLPASRYKRQQAVAARLKSNHKLTYLSEGKHPRTFELSYSAGADGTEKGGADVPERERCAVCVCVETAHQPSKRTTTVPAASLQAVQGRQGQLRLRLFE